jgi:methylthioribose-1-phosphate isomerase
MSDETTSELARLRAEKSKPSRHCDRITMQRRIRMQRREIRRLNKKMGEYGAELLRQSLYVKSAHAMLSESNRLEKLATELEEARDIVRRLAEIIPEITALACEPLEAIAYDALKLWDDMQAKGGGDDEAKQD